MNQRQHALLARALQDACGGPEKCLELLAGTPHRTKRSWLYKARDPNSHVTMTMGQVAVLEGHQNWRLYSLTLSRQRAAPTETLCALDEACEGTADMGAALRLIRHALADDVITETEAREIEPMLQQVEARLAGIRSAFPKEGGQ